MAATINGDGLITLDGTTTTQGRVRLAEDTDNGTNYVELQAAANIASNVTFTLPSADGTSGQVIQTNGSGVLSFATISASNFQEFTASGTYTKPAGATFVMVELWGAGGGGGSGSRAGNCSGRPGGGGGGGGAYKYRLFKAGCVGSTETVTIGAGGTGGTAQTSNNSSGNDGVDGGNTTFGSLLTAYGGSKGQGAQVCSNTRGGSGGGVLSTGALSCTFGGGPYTYTSAGGTQSWGQFGGALGRQNALGFASGFGGGAGAGICGFGCTGGPYAGGSSAFGGAGGGSGGFVKPCNTVGNGGAGGSTEGLNGGGGAGGTAGAAGTAGGAFKGGGGGAGKSTGAGAAGGAGGTAAGGGGGGAVANCFASGVGGAGGAGYARVYTW